MHPAPPPQALPVHPPGSLLGRLLLLAALGFLVLIMIGPLVAVVSAVLSVIVSVAAVVLSLAVALLPLALIGLLVWGVYQAAAPGRESAGMAFKQRFKDFGRTFGRFTGQTIRWTYRAMRWTSVKGWDCLAVAGRGVRRSVLAIRQTVSGRGRVLARMGLEIACGAILATGVCLAASDGAPEAIPVGILAGAILGGAIGISRPEKRVQPG
jgi:hypothetical protein